jgi:hypothetical protein
MRLPWLLLSKMLFGTSLPGENSHVFQVSVIEAEPSGNISINNEKDNLRNANKKEWHKNKTILNNTINLNNMANNAHQFNINN